MRRRKSAIPTKQLEGAARKKILIGAGVMTLVNLALIAVCYFLLPDPAIFQMYGGEATYLVKWVVILIPSVFGVVPAVGAFFITNESLAKKALVISCIGVFLFALILAMNLF